MVNHQLLVLAAAVNEADLHLIILDRDALECDARMQGKSTNYLVANEPPRGGSKVFLVIQKRNF